MASADRLPYDLQVDRAHRDVAAYVRGRAAYERLRLGLFRPDRDQLPLPADPTGWTLAPPLDLRLYDDGFARRMLELRAELMLSLQLRSPAALARVTSVVF